MFLDDLSNLTGLHWLWRLDLGWGKSTTLGDIGRQAARLALRGGRSGRGLRAWDIENVEGAASGGLDSGLASWIVGNMVAIDDIVVPVSLALLQHGTLKSEGTLPCTGLGGILGKGELTIVVVPGAEKVDGLAVAGGSERKVKLDSGHFGLL